MRSGGRVSIPRPSKDNVQSPICCTLSSSLVGSQEWEFRNSLDTEYPDEVPWKKDVWGVNDVSLILAFLKPVLSTSWGQ